MKQLPLLPFLFLAYFGILSLFQWNLSVWRLWVGGVLGFVFLIIDRLVYVYITYPEEPLSQTIKELVRTKQVKEGLATLWKRREEQIRTTMRSVFFMGMWIPLALYVITSTGSMVATGMIMAIGLYLALEVSLLLSNPQLIQQRFFWMVQRQLSVQEIYGTVGVFLFFFFLFTTFLL